MSRYFFHIKRGQVKVLDQEGIELANTARAEVEAARRTQQIVNGEALKGMPVRSGVIIVADDNWHVVWIAFLIAIKGPWLSGAARFSQRPITLGFQGHEPLHHGVKVCASVDRIERTTRKFLKVDKKLFRSQFQEGNFVFEFAHCTEPPTTELRP